MWTRNRALTRAVKEDGPAAQLARTLAEVPHPLVVTGEHPLMPVLNEIGLPVHRILA